MGGLTPAGGYAGDRGPAQTPQAQAAQNQLLGMHCACVFPG